MCYFIAYEVLLDPKRRKQYDQFGENSENARDGHHEFAYNFNFDDFMRQFDEHLGDFHQKFQTQNKKGKKTEGMFNFGNIFNVCENDIHM